MARYINVDALLKQIEIDSKGIEGSYGDTWQFMDTIESIPTIDHLAEVSKKGDLISRKAVFYALECMRFASDAERRYASSMLEQIPIAQPEMLACGEGELIAQPEIIRCKDCKFWETTWVCDFDANLHYCPLVDGVRKCDFYCADAERRTDE